MPRPRPGRKRGSKDVRSVARARRRAVIAAAAVAGKPLAAVAREEGISRTWASQEAHAPETELLIAHLLDIHQERVARLVGQALDVIEAGLKAEPKDKADHPMRLLAARRLLQFTLAGRVAKPAEEKLEQGTVTLDVIYRMRQRLIK